MGCQGEGGAPRERALREKAVAKRPLWLGAQGGSGQERPQAELVPGQCGHPTGEDEDRDSGLTSNAHLGARCGGVRAPELGR